MIAIVDYGLGNIKAFANVFKRLNIAYCFADSPVQLVEADKIVLPGVGAFDYAMSLLNNSGMRETLDSLVLDRGVPVLGICVGMQILADSSEEGCSNGLGWISGRIKKFPDLTNNENHLQLPLPHMGWNNIVIEKEDSLVDGLGSHSRFYFLHSYYFDCAEVENTLASAEYGVKFSCIVKKNNIYGIQCHPEKSHANGIAFLEKFALT